jgi:cobalt-zinc-cadmium efflux system outer membrane protein
MRRAFMNSAGRSWLAAGVIAAAWHAAAPCAEPISARRVNHTATLGIKQGGEPIPAPVPEPERGLEDFERMALSSNPSIARAQAMVNAARGNWVQVGLPPNPEFGYLGQQIGSNGLAEQDGALAQQEIVRGGKLCLNRQIAAQEIARAQQELAAQQQRVLTDVRISFFQVLVAQQQKATTDKLVDVAKKSVDNAQKLLDAKEVSVADVLQAELEVENVLILSQNANNRLWAAWQQLSAVVGNRRMPLEPVTGQVTSTRDPIEWDHALDRLLTTSPEIGAAVANIERARWRVQRAIVEPTPNVTVQGLVNWRDNGIGGHSDGGIQVTLPLPTWNKNQGAVMQAQNEVAAAERALQQLELSMQQRLAPVYERYQNARNQATRYRESIIPKSEKTLDIANRLYASGETNYLTLLTAQRTYFQTQLNYLEALRELRSAEAEIDGLLLTGSLQER